MPDLKSKHLMYLKGLLFLLVLLLSTGLILLEAPSWKIAFLLSLTIWAAARFYYFMFYVIEKYVDSSYRFSSMYSFAKYLVSKK